MLEFLGNRRHELMKLLVRSKTGLTVEEIAGHLSITRNAVRQHLAGLMNEGVVATGATRPSGGRPGVVPAPIFMDGGAARRLDPE